ncbi:ADP-ribosylglycohydrolase family protein [Rhodococcus sp. BP-252]|uniref:Ribosylglycohydrolase n=1 Tax=Rhodococcoides kyotonense TaxID=398843 RepID=A0A177YDM0_9NOCA|nr:MULTISPECIES: ADP-ribosylglycohydrolase family protein [Rhodococcus]MBY6414087.1 ADP-ribosylglycohydrolase family protein [Rhodococcus sp. BP-320]MBY6418858.1 ADP-ribosylglycohydrolase family protein [Rhodococcus sp. BP-321]MBY6423397.1 ADP-ribosylglycohydrolase family protein [Rhodococcus sp. BP-324]MBY6428851.1 ADP-ribosylglycohydrolase family protein [Rhodococcus sp. BP-323]MBY6433857.1 ADP-ribosylglycohydrolase family protein [Rhodococcus sp. BP-322]
MALTMEQNDRAAGVLLGTAAGDALGAGYEFTYPAPGMAVDMIGGGTFDWAPGEWTDDTSMAAAVALAARDEDVSSVRGLDAIVANFVAWYDTDPVDVGTQTRKVLGHRSSTAAEMTARAAALTGRTGGNGSLMRTAPVALAFLDDADRCVAAAQAVSALTHSDPQAGEACALWSYAIRHAVLHGNFDGPRLWLDTAGNAADTWRALLDEAEAGDPSDFAQNGWVVHALQTAWSAITRAESDGPEHLVRALESCVLAGGDTDTTAAIAGGLLGARWGASAVPTKWRSMLHGYPSLTGEDLVALAADITGGRA